MKEYIERQALIEHMEDLPVWGMYGTELDRADVIASVENAPAADVVEVKHSSWMPYFEYVEIYNTGGYREKKQTGWICKKCKSRKSFTTVKENYCSYCGAKMDKEET